MRRATRQKDKLGGGANLPLTGNLADGQQRTIDNKELLKSRPDPLVVERANAYSDVLDKMEESKDKAQQAGADLLAALLKSHAVKRVTVESRYGRRTFTTATLTKLVKTKQATDK